MNSDKRVYPTGMPEDVAKLYEDVHKDLRRFLAHRLNSTGDAEDVAHDVFERLCRLPSLDHIEDVRKYLFTTAHRLALNHLRHRKVVQESMARNEAAGAVANEPGPERVLDGRGCLEQTWRTITALPEKTCSVFLLHRFGGYTYGQIAELSGLSRKSVEYHMKRALRAIAAAVDLSNDGIR